MYFYDIFLQCSYITCNVIVILINVYIIICIIICIINILCENVALLLLVEKIAKELIFLQHNSGIISLKILGTRQSKIRIKIFMIISFYDHHLCGSKKRKEIHPFVCLQIIILFHPLEIFNHKEFGKNMLNIIFFT